MSKKQRLNPPALTKINLADYSPNHTENYDKSSARAEEEQLEERLSLLQERLYAENKQALLVVFQAMDAGGKDSGIKKVFLGVNPMGVKVASFKQPSTLELSHDFLWRVHREVPPKGYIGIFNRSHYEDVLIARVNKLVPRKVWEQRYDHINDFERLLVTSGTRVIKFFLHISKEEQKERFEERLSNPEKHWKFSSADLEVRKLWDQYMKAYETAITRTNTDYAPWYIIPANKKWYRDLVITRILVETLEAMNPQFPPPEPNLDQIVIPD